MKHFVFLLLVSQWLTAQTYITHVTVVDIEKHKLLPDRTVVLRGDRVEEVTTSGRKIPHGSTVIDGTGKFLMPGLVDAHVHFFQSGGLYTRPDAIDLRKRKPYDREISETHARMENTLRRYLANGITTVIDPGATYNFLDLKRKLSDRSLTTVFMSGPLITTYEPEPFKGLGDDAPFQLVNTPEEGRNMVRSQLSHHPDFIKIWYIADIDGTGPDAGAKKFQPVVQAIIDEAHKNGLRVAVHATERITARLAVESGCDYLVHSVEDQDIDDDFVALLKAKKVVLCPTLAVGDGYDTTFAQTLGSSREEIRKADAYSLGSLLDLRHLPDTALIQGYRRYFLAEAQVNKARTHNNTMLRNLKKLVDGGVLIASGTDAGNIGTLHAASYLSELRRMKEAGLSNWQILEASTLGGAKAMGKEADFGSIVKGKRANLLLLDADPTQQIDNLDNIDKVFVNGVMSTPAETLTETPEELVQRQVNAYNFRNIEAFLDTYSDDVEVYSFPNTLEYKGKETTRKEYGSMFERITNLHCQIVNRIVDGNHVIDREHVRFRDKWIDGTAIYVVEKGKIAKVYFLPEAK